MSGIWAVARNVIKEIIRMRLLMVFIVLVTLSCTVGLALWLHGSTGPGNEKVQTFLGYSLRLMDWFLSLLTIFLAIATIARDIKRKEIFTVTTKPISRGALLGGKLLGVALFNAVLLLVAGGLVYGLAELLARTEPTNDMERARLRAQVLTARQGVQPVLPDVSAEAAKKTQVLVDQRRQDEQVSDPRKLEGLRARIYHEVAQQLVMRYRSAVPGGVVTFHFKGVTPRDPGGMIFVRYKPDVSVNPPGLTVNSEWLYGPRDPLASGGGGRYVVTRDAIRTVHEFAAPASAVGVNGDFYVAYRNHPSNAPAVVVFPEETGMEVLYVAGSFEGNLARGLALIYVRLLLLAILGLAAGAWVSFPVAVLLVLVLYFLGLASGFIREAVQYDTSGGLAAAIQGVLLVLPKLSSYDPVGALEKGRLVSGRMVAGGVVFLLGAAGGTAGLLGYLLFKFRELARVIV